MRNARQNRIGALLGAIGLAVAVLAPGCSRSAAEPRPVASPAGAATSAPAVSDLDTPVATLLAARCEHGIAQYTCDECRYQVGVAKAADDLFDPAKGGTLETAVIGVRPLAGGRELNGEVRLDGSRAVVIGPRAAGVVRSLHVDLGARVAEGRTLLELESAEYRQARADVGRVTAAVELARATVARERDLHRRGVSAQKDLLEAEAAVKQAEAEQAAVAGRLLAFGLTAEEVEALAAGRGAPPLMPVRAPFAGTILERSVSLGAQVQPGDRLLMLGDTSRVWVVAALYELDVAAVAEAQRTSPVSAEVHVVAFPDRTFRGRLERIGGTFDETTRTATARVVVDNYEGLLRPGMFARVRLLGPRGEGALAVPEASVLQDEGRSFVFVRAEGPYFVRRPVAVGRASDGWVEIAGDVKSGDTVVAKGAFLLKSDVLRSKMGAGCAD